MLGSGVCALSLSVPFLPVLDSLHPSTGAPRRATMSLRKGSDVDEKDVAVVVRPVDDLKKLGYEQELERVSVW